MQEMIKGGTTVLFVSHSIDLIKKLCNRVVWLEHGKVIEVGDPEEICEKYIRSQVGEQ
jgi:ABC-type polysaccharide/polyol phosphate transport system ATPase subunit